MHWSESREDRNRNRSREGGERTCHGQIASLLRPSTFVRTCLIGEPAQRVDGVCKAFVRQKTTLWRPRRTTRIEHVRQALGTCNIDVLFRVAQRFLNVFLDVVGCKYESRCRVMRNKVSAFVRELRVDLFQEK